MHTGGSSLWLEVVVEWVLVLIHNGYVQDSNLRSESGHPQVHVVLSSSKLLKTGNDRFHLHS